MSSTSSQAPEGPVVDQVLARARDGDGRAFEELVAPLRRELSAHCYRMLGSFHDAEDALQDALVRAWRGIGVFEGRSSLRRWLHSVATHACLDAARARGRRSLPMDLGPASADVVAEDTPQTEIAWLGPWPTPSGSASAGPEDRLEQREDVRLAFVAALQHLPPNQRAALLLFEVLGYPASEVAQMMDTSTASINSALQRARAGLDALTPSAPASAPRAEDEQLHAIASAYASALDRGDVGSLVAMLTADVTWSMPPMAHWYQGIDAVTAFAAAVPFGSCGEWRHVLVSANGQPAAASYLRAHPENAYLAWAINVLTVRDRRIAEVTSFIGDGHFSDFGLPLSLP